MGSGAEGPAHVIDICPGLQ